jgi:hypothetical protein
MSNRVRHTALGVGLVLSLATFATPGAQAAHITSARNASHAARTASAPAGRGLLTALWSYLVGPNTHDPKPTQGPTVDPNGIS